MERIRAKRVPLLRERKALLWMLRVMWMLLNTCANYRKNYFDFLAMCLFPPQFARLPFTLFSSIFHLSTRLKGDFLNASRGVEFWVRASTAPEFENLTHFYFGGNNPFYKICLLKNKVLKHIMKKNPNSNVDIFLIEMFFSPTGPAYLQMKVFTYT